MNSCHKYLDLHSFRHFIMLGLLLAWPVDAGGALVAAAWFSLPPRSSISTSLQCGTSGPAGQANAGWLGQGGSEWRNDHMAAQGMWPHHLEWGGARVRGAPAGSKTASSGDTRHALIIKSTRHIQVYTQCLLFTCAVQPEGLGAVHETIDESTPHLWATAENPHVAHW